MPYWRLFYHLIWATRDRLPLIDAGMWPELEQLLVFTARKNQMIVHGVGGVANHVHMAVSIPPAMSVANAVGRLKGSSSRMMSHNPDDSFGWQSEYGVVSFAERHLQQVVAFIHDQPRHHAQNTLWPALEQLDGSSASTTGRSA